MRLLVFFFFFSNFVCSKKYKLTILCQNVHNTTKLNFYFELNLKGWLSGQLFESSTLHMVK